MEPITLNFTWQLATLIIWELVWKGFALYRAGKKQQPVWFVLLLILNTMGILPIIYLLVTQSASKKKETKKKR